MKKQAPQQQDDSPPSDSPGWRTRRRVSMRQRSLFDLAKLDLKPAQRRNRMTPLDRRFVIDAIRDIYRLSNEPHIRQIAEDVLFAHRIPIEEEPSA